MMVAYQIFLGGLRVGSHDFRVIWTWKSWLFGWFLRVAANTLLWTSLGLVLGQQHLIYILIGNAAIAGLGVYALPVATWNRMEGTYSYMVIAPGPFAPAIIGRMSVWFLSWIASALFSFGLMVLLFEVPVTLIGLTKATIAIVAMCCSMLALSASLGGLLGRTPQLRGVFSWLMLFSVNAFCGVNVPVEFWPPPLQFFAQIIPVTHGLQAIRIGLDGNDWSTGVLQILLEFGVALVWGVVAAVTFERFAERGRLTGAIEFS